MSSTKSFESKGDSCPACQHDELLLTPSPYAAEVGFRPPNHGGAATKRKGSKDNDAVSPKSFPAPLVLPGDELALDPQYPPQSLRSWQRDQDRNIVTPERNVIYVAAPPSIDSDVDFIDSWMHPNLPERTKNKVPNQSTEVSSSPPDTKDIIDYISAFYHPLPVRFLPSPLTFTAWDSTSPKPKPSSTSRSSKRKRNPPPSFIAVRTSTELVRIRTRPCPDSLFSFQLNLDDLLDVAISILPSDAYALLLLVSHDLYESDDDVFVCGRAYGGSRVAVVSSTRYNPILDDIHHVDRTHAWPASHCKNYVEACCSAVAPLSLKTGTSINKTRSQGLNPSSPILLSSSPAPPRFPLQLALHRHITNPLSPSLLYLIRLSLTSAHELGHCFGLDHCVYYACCMQGSASLAEDARQPPYLCPVCEEKVLLATGADRKERMRRLREVCGRWGWSGFEGWLEGMLA
ncbi:MAG: hypothetical protein Q9225_005697 [Loekoesia sp. 1 TL-2023]